MLLVMHVCKRHLLKMIKQTATGRMTVSMVKIGRTSFLKKAVTQLAHSLMETSIRSVDLSI